MLQYITFLSHGKWFLKEPPTCFCPFCPPLANQYLIVSITVVFTRTKQPVIWPEQGIEFSIKVIL